MSCLLIAMTGLWTDAARMFAMSLTTTMGAWLIKIIALLCWTCAQPWIQLIMFGIVCAWHTCDGNTN